MYLQRNTGGKPFEASGDFFAQHYTRLTKEEYDKLVAVHAARAATIRAAYFSLGATSEDIGDIEEKNFWTRGDQEDVGITFKNQYLTVKFAA